MPYPRYLAPGLHQCVEAISEGVGLLFGAEEGAGEVDEGNGCARGYLHLGVGMGGDVRAIQTIQASIGLSAGGNPGGLGPVHERNRHGHIG